MNSDDYSQPDPSFKENMVSAPLRFVRCTFDRQSNGKTRQQKEYTYRIEPDAKVVVGQYAVTRKNMSRVTIVAVDTEAVPNLDLSRYDFVDPIPMPEDDS